MRGEESRNNIEIFRTYCSSARRNTRRIHFRFLETPVRIHTDDASKALTLTVAKNTLTGPPFGQVARSSSLYSELQCGLIFRSVGYRGLPIAGLEFDEATGTIRNDRGRCLKASSLIRGVYVTGWIKRGATGIIGTNRADSVETVASILEDLPILASAPKPDAEYVGLKLMERGIRVVGYAEWQKIDNSEKQRGQLKDKPREKYTTVPEMIAVCE
jgi:ferredoxin--NADP+ reductase